MGTPAIPNLYTMTHEVGTEGVYRAHVRREGCDRMYEGKDGIACASSTYQALSPPPAKSLGTRLRSPIWKNVPICSQGLARFLSPITARSAAQRWGFGRK